MPISSGLGLAGMPSRPRPRLVGMGLAPAPKSRLLTPASTLPETPVETPKTPARPVVTEGNPEDTPLGAIGLLLSNVAAGLRGQPLPSDQLEEQRMKREQMKMLKAKNDIDIAASIVELGGKVPGAERESFMSGMVQKFAGQVDESLVKALSGEPDFTANGKLFSERLALIDRTLGRDAAIEAAKSKEWRDQTRAEIAEEKQPIAAAKVRQWTTIARKAVQEGEAPPEVMGMLSGTMTPDRVRQINNIVPPEFRLDAAEIYSLEEKGLNEGGITILPRDTAAKVAEQQALMPGRLTEAEEKEKLKRRYNPSESAMEGEYGKSLEGRATAKFLRYQEMLRNGTPLSPAEQEDYNASRRILERPSMRADPETGQIVPFNPEPLPPAPGQAIQGAAQAQADAPPTASNAHGKPLFDLAEEGTGVVSGIKEAVGRTVGQVYEGAVSPETTQARQTFETSTNALIRALSLNPKYPVAEQQRIQKEFSIKPSVIDSPEALRQRMISIDASVDEMIERENRVLSDPKEHIDRKKESKVARDALVEYKRQLGVPPAIKSSEEYDTLPEGARYIYDGEIYVKGKK